MGRYRDRVEIEALEAIIDQDQAALAEEMNKCEADLPDFVDRLLAGDLNDLLINEVYSKERGRRVEVFGIELDEMWSFVQNKENKVWIWLALNPYNRQIVGMHLGGRSAKDARKLWESIPEFFRQNAHFFSDYWQAYQTILDPEQHFAVGKASGLTAHIERFNGTMRQRVSRLVRKALSFSKSFENHLGAIKYFICQYNLEKIAL